MKYLQLGFLLFILLSIGCNKISPVSEADSLSPASIPKEKNLFAFIGEKIEVKEFTPELEDGEVLMDASFKAKYKIIETVYGNYDKDVIEFEVYDHYGYPHFANYKNVLLFVSKEDGKYYHLKYQYFDVYKTKNGKWASCGDPYKFDDVDQKDVKAVKLEFDKPIFFDLKRELPNYDDEYVKEIFTKPYFKIVENKAECLIGTYADQLFVVKNRIFKAAGIF